MEGNSRYIMNYKTSVSFEDKTIFGIRKLVRSGSFRNKSHVVEYAVNKLIEDFQDENK